MASSSPFGPAAWLAIAIHINTYLRRTNPNIYISEEVFYINKDKIDDNYECQIKTLRSVSELNEFKPRLKSPKNRFQLGADLNLEKFNFKWNQQYLSHRLNLSRGSNSGFGLF